MNKVVFSSASCEWNTPTAFFNQLDDEFHFTLDVCASADNCLVDAYYDVYDLWSSLTKPWPGVCWVNPPYGRTIAQWIKKAYESSLQGSTVVCLVPSRTDVKWWHDWAMKANEIRFIQGRLKYSNSQYNAPFPNALLVFRAWGI